VLSALRAAQLLRGCRPRIEGSHKTIMTAQLKVAEGKVTQLFDPRVIADEPVTSSRAPV
jgi:hypothetical protein